MAAWQKQPRTRRWASTLEISMTVNTVAASASPEAGREETGSRLGHRQPPPCRTNPNLGSRDVTGDPGPSPAV